jgi:arsenate reductase
MQTVEIWHNPRCSKSRDSFNLLKDRGVDTKVIEYIKTPPTKDELKDLLKKLSLSAKDIIRTKESIYKELNLKSVDSEDELIKAMIENPKLIERPIVVKGDKAVIGRPIENVINLLG